MEFSIIISTHNRAESLARTLDSFNAVEIPKGATVEMLLVDNASTDGTSTVAKEAKLKNVALRYLYEGRKGKSNALNAALAQVRGQVILFTDDDVVPAKDWLEQMGRPLLERECDGAVGRVPLAKEVCRPWMTENYNGGLPMYDGPGDKALDLIGANMGVHRSVFERISAFDPEIGPGAMGLCEDTVFTLQLAEAGFRLRYIPEAVVVHYPDPTRLLRRHVLSNSRRFGASLAYVLYHWRHEKLTAPRLRCYYLAAKLLARRLVQPPPPLDSETAPSWEASYVAEMAKCRQFLIERRRARNYSKHGLRKL